VVICLQETETRSIIYLPVVVSTQNGSNLDIRPETPKLVQERAGNTLEVIGISKYFLNGTPAAQ
jgi:hypothetical protein